MGWSLADTNFVLICYSIDDPGSLENVRERWVPMIRHLKPGIPFVLLGLHPELRDDPHTVQELSKCGFECVTAAQGLEMARETGAHFHVECSPYTGENVELPVRALMRYWGRDRTRMERFRPRSGSGCITLSSNPQKQARAQHERSTIAQRPCC